MENNNLNNNLERNEEKPFSYGTVRKEEGIGCSPTFASGCAIVVIAIIILVILATIIVPIVFSRFF